MTETTIKSYKEPGTRLQLVRINFQNNAPYYQVRENRCIKRTSTDLIAALNTFDKLVKSKINQTFIENM